MTWIKTKSGGYRCTVCRIKVNVKGEPPTDNGNPIILHVCRPRDPNTPAPKPEPITRRPTTTMLDDSEWLAILPCIHRTEQLEPGSVTCCGGGINLYPVYGCNQRARCAVLTFHNGQKEVACYACPDRATLDPLTNQPVKQPKPAPTADKLLPKPPGPITATGTCHICQQPAQPITYCRYCGHWLCPTCSTNWLARGWAALKEQLGFTRPDCCGPTSTPVQ